MAYFIIWQRNTQVYIFRPRNHEYKKTDSINSVKSSLKSHPVVVINPVHKIKTSLQTCNCRNKL